MNLPFYCIIGRRPVRAIATANGGLRVEALDWKTGLLECNMEYLDRVLLPDTGVLIVDKQEFDRRVEALRASAPDV